MKAFSWICSAQYGTNAHQGSSVCWLHCLRMLGCRKSGTSRGSHDKKHKEKTNNQCSSNFEGILLSQDVQQLALLSLHLLSSLSFPSIAWGALQWLVVHLWNPYRQPCLLPGNTSICRLPCEYLCIARFEDAK